MRARSARLRLRSAALVASLLLVLGAGVAAGPVAAHGADGPPKTGLRGLAASDTGPCAGGYRLTGTDFCTHGPDEAPPGRRAALLRRSLAATLTAPLPDAVLCDGDGRSGKRVQAIYARVAGSPSRRATVLPRIRDAAADVQAAFLGSAARTDGVRRPRWATDAGCGLAVAEVTLSAKARTSFNATITELQDLGFDRTDRKYLIWWDTNVYCGIATFRGDDRRGAANASEALSGYARVDEPCWGFGEAHELMHTLGAVQDSAPHTTFGTATGAFAHCTDDYDVMCYQDAPGVTLTVVCDDRALDTLFDCGNDDYFHTHPADGSYLATHWNTADSGWLVRSVAGPVAPVPSLAAGAEVSPTRIPVSVALAARPPLDDVEMLRAQRRLRDGSWAPIDQPPTPVIGVGLVPGSPAAWRSRTTATDGTATPWLTGPTTTAERIDDRAVAFRWGRGWRSVAGTDALDGTLTTARKARRSVTLAVKDAAEVGVVATTGPLAGRLQIRVDGSLRRTVDLQAGTEADRVLVAAVDVTPGRHTIELRVKAPRTETPGWSVAIDSVVLLDR